MQAARQNNDLQRNSTASAEFPFSATTSAEDSCVEATRSPLRSNQSPSFSPKSVDSASSLNVHNCQYCFKTFRTVENLSRHQRRHTKPVTCPVLGCPDSRQANSEEVMRHLARKHPDSYSQYLNPCPARARGCGQSFPGRPDSLKRHLSSARHISRYGQFHNAC